MSKNNAVVILSGGQDSTTCLGIAKFMFDDVKAIAFSYGQKHTVELMCARRICEVMGVPLTIHEIPSLRHLNDSALIQGNEANVGEAHHANDKLPASFVPNRNALFITIAHAYAQKVGARTLITGVCQTDYSGYPDCRRKFIDAIESALNLGYKTSINIMTPLMYLTKAETFAIAEAYNCLDEVIDLSHTCYNGDHNTQHSWGYGCAECPACKLRAKGHKEFVAGDFQQFKLNYIQNCKGW